MSYHWPPGFKPTMKDETLPHQIGFMNNSWENGVRVTCNCGWKSQRCVDTTNPMDEWDLYRSHLPR